MQAGRREAHAFGKLHDIGIAAAAVLEQRRHGLAARRRGLDIAHCRLDLHPQAACHGVLGSCVSWHFGQLPGQNHLNTDACKQQPQCTCKPVLSLSAHCNICCIGIIHCVCNAHAFQEQKRRAQRKGSTEEASIHIPSKPGLTRTCSMLRPNNWGEFAWVLLVVASKVEYSCTWLSTAALLARMHTLQHCTCRTSF